MDLNNLLEKALPIIQAASSLQDLENIRVEYFGKKGMITELSKSLASLSATEKPIVGKKINEIRSALIEALNLRQEFFQTLAINEKLRSEACDITLPGLGNQKASLHPTTQVKNLIQTFFANNGFTIASGPDIEDEFHNFDALNIPATHPARAMMDTFYFETGRVLRTHTSSVQIRYMEQHQPPIRIIAPGKAFRKDDLDMTHVPIFHQVEGLVVDENIRFVHLKGTILALLQYLFQTDIKIRLRASYFPFTEPSAEVDMTCVNCGGKACRICKQTGWLEIMGCGMVHPNVLKSVGIDAEKYSGFAFGIGIERVAMLKYRLDDIRYLYENDLAFLQQF